LAADENLNRDVVRGLLRIVPGIDFVRVQDRGLGGATGPDVLAWAADEGRVLVTHDRETMVDFAQRRVAAGLLMPGRTVVGRRSGVGRAIEDLARVVEASESQDRRGQVCYLPF
jgi:hypothetical protein